MNRNDPGQRELFITLPGGRRMGYAEYGALGGRPVLFFHGAPGSRHIHADMVGAAVRHGVRLVAPERPGYGLSGPQPGRSIPDWASDVAALADALGLQRFGIVAFSMGSVYAMACACRLPDRVTRMALVGALAPLDAPGVTEGMAPSVSGLFALARSGPDALRDTLAPLAESPAALLAAFSASLLLEWDKSVVGERAAEFEAEYAQMLQGGIEGAVSDYMLAAEEWGFPLDGIHAETHLWCGADDRNTPPAMTAHLSSVLPNSRTTVLPGEGHLSLYAHWEEILEWVGQDRAADNNDGASGLS